MPKLTDRSALNLASQLTDELHIVRSGVSFRQSLDLLFRSSAIPWRGELVGNEVVIFKKDRSSTAISTVNEDDLVIVINKASKRLIVAYSLIDLNAPTIDNLNDSSKYMKFIDTTALL